jgi:hypothetical protein
LGPAAVAVAARDVGVAAGGWKEIGFEGSAVGCLRFAGGASDEGASP